MGDRKKYEEDEYDDDEYDDEYDEYDDEEEEDGRRGFADGSGSNNSGATGAAAAAAASSLKKPTPAKSFPRVLKRVAGFTQNSNLIVEVAIYLAIFCACCVVLLILLKLCFIYASSSTYFNIGAFVMFAVTLSLVNVYLINEYEILFFVQMFAVFVGILFILLLLYRSMGRDVAYDIVFYVVFGLTVLFALAMVYVYLREKINVWRRRSFFAAFLFYLPCLLTDLWNYVMKEFSLTPYRMWLFLAVEIALSAVIWYRESIISWARGGGPDQQPGRRPDSVVLVSWKPVILDSYQVVGENSMINQEVREQVRAGAAISPNDAVVSANDTSVLSPLGNADPNSSSRLQTQTINYLDSMMSTAAAGTPTGSAAGTPASLAADANIPSNFSISFWLFANHLDSPSQNGRAGADAEVEIFKYGSSSSSSTPNNFHPRLVYVNSADAGAGMQQQRRQSFRVYYNFASTADYLSFDMSFQKWHFLVFTYQNNKFDLFADGLLVESAAVSVPQPFTYNDVVTLGDPAQAASLKVWAVRDMVYSFQPLSLRDIVNSFNIKKNLL